MKNLLAIVFMCVSVLMFSQEPISLVYAHMNPSDSVAGKQAQLFADLVAKKSNGKIKIDIYPASQLGGLKDMVDQISSGKIMLHHNTMAGIGNLYPDFAALDTPYIYKDVNHMLKVCSVDSPLMQKLNDGLIKTKGVRVLYTFYFGTRELTCNKAVYSPKDLKGINVRSIPFPIYNAAVEGLGAVPVAVDFSELRTAFSAGLVSGQENPVDVIWTSKFYEVQKFLMLTDHIIGAECVVINEKAWQAIPANLKKVIQESALETSKQATKMTLDLENGELKQLKDKGMTVIGPQNGLKIAEFKKNTKTVVDAKLTTQYAEIYKIIQSIK
jgi:TRAP-type transport system periplasmic protein